MSANGVRYFQDVFHWETQGKPSYAALARLAKRAAEGTSWRFEHDLPAVDRAASFADLQQRHSLREVFPVQDARIAGQGDKNGLIDLRQHAPAIFRATGNGDWSTSFLMPRVVDVTHALLEFDPAWVPERLNVTAWNEGGLCGQCDIADNRNAQVLIVLAGNPTACIEVMLRDGRVATPVLRAAHFLSFGIVRDSGGASAGDHPIVDAGHSTFVPEANAGLLARICRRLLG
jgi:hypothetical protein